MQLDPNAQQSLRMARYLSVVSTFARGVGILGIIGSVIGLLAASNVSGSSDRVGFSLLSLVVLLIAFVVWSAATFHGMSAKLAPLLVRIDERLEELEKRQRQHAAAAAAAAPVAPPAPALAPVVAAAAEPVLAPAWPGPPAPEPALAIEPAPEPVAPEPEPSVSAPEPEPVAPEPVRTPCPHCGGLIHPEATRCVHCMKRVARA